MQITTVQPATVPTSPASPNVPLNLVSAFSSGSRVGHRHRRTPQGSRHAHPHAPRHRTHHRQARARRHRVRPRGQGATAHRSRRSAQPPRQSFRSFRTNLQFLNFDGGQTNFVISSAGPGEGKSTTAANLAIALAETGARVVLIDGDLRLPQVAHYMGIEGGVGLTDVLIGRAELRDVMQKWGRGRLYVLPAGAFLPIQANCSARPRWTGARRARRALRLRAGRCPPPPPRDGRGRGEQEDHGAILVAASGATKKPELLGAVRTLETAGANCSAWSSRCCPPRARQLRLRRLHVRCDTHR